jgi:hypothetical protein
MTPQQKIKEKILHESDIGVMPGDDIDAIYDEHQDDCWDAFYEVRPGEVETDVNCEGSRHYESKSVAAKMRDGSWVGWTYWYGGGKHGEPESIPWMEEAYDLDCVEEEKMVVVRTFKKK